MDQMLRLLHGCGLPLEDVDFINSDGATMNKLLLEVNFCNFTNPHNCLFFFSLCIFFFKLHLQFYFQSQIIPTLSSEI